MRFLLVEPRRQADASRMIIFAAGNAGPIEQWSSRCADKCSVGTDAFERTRQALGKVRGRSVPPPAREHRDTLSRSRDGPPAPSPAGAAPRSGRSSASPPGTSRRFRRMSRARRVPDRCRARRPRSPCAARPVSNAISPMLSPRLISLARGRRRRQRASVRRARSKGPGPCRPRRTAFRRRAA